MDQRQEMMDDAIDEATGMEGEEEEGHCGSFHRLHHLLIAPDGLGSSNSQRIAESEE
jgi:hypothetical protein